MYRIWMEKYGSQLIFASNDTLEQLLLDTNYVLDELAVTDPISGELRVRRFRDSIYREIHKRKFKYCLRELQVYSNYANRFSRVEEWIENVQGTSGYNWVPQNAQSIVPVYNSETVLESGGENVLESESEYENVQESHTENVLEPVSRNVLESDSENDSEPDSEGYLASDSEDESDTSTLKVTEIENTNDSDEDIEEIISDCSDSTP